MQIFATVPFPSLSLPRAGLYWKRTGSYDMFSIHVEVFIVVPNGCTGRWSEKLSVVETGQTQHGDNGDEG